ncbi:hypothetical protein O996_00375 [Enterococcus faecalis BM4654]|uniref:Uncharacterized protein n=1 Tax=Enterococcus faecium TaxID=1352 RepID=A0A455TXR5_ENTFC|nr:hypothetical protein O996_00375 [Enterococcus faecalis BM4654]BBI40123.1 hypothetical protein SMVRE20_02497 [Enterococcus faecium]
MTGQSGLRKRRTPNGGPAFFTPIRRAGNEVQHNGHFSIFRCRSKLKNLLVGGSPPIPRTSALRAPVETPLRAAARPADASQNHTARRHRWACSFSFSGWVGAVDNSLSTLALAVKISCISFLALTYSA